MRNKNFGFVEEDVLKTVEVVKNDQFLEKYVVDYALYKELLEKIEFDDIEIFESFRQRMLRMVRPYVRKL